MKQNQTVNVQLILTGEREDCFNTSNFNIHSRKKCFAPATDKDESILIFFFKNLIILHFQFEILITFYF